MPPGFRRYFADHNRSCWFAAAVSLGSAWLAWLFVLALYTGAVLVFETVRTGNVEASRPPAWYFFGACVGAGFLLVGAAARRWRKRFRPPADRPIIGWHLIPETMFLPASLTYAIWDHVGARVSYPPQDWPEAWQLLRLIFSMKRADVSRLALREGDGPRIARILEGLQLVGLIDLHRGEDDWFYRVPTDKEPLLAEWEEEIRAEE